VQTFEKSYLLSILTFFLTMILIIVSTGLSWVIIPAAMAAAATVYFLWLAGRQRRDQYSGEPQDEDD
jgi:hypothetical protein